MVIILSLAVALLYTQARASRDRVLKLKSEENEFSDYFRRVKPQYDSAYGMCEKLMRMAQTDPDAARILQHHGIRIDAHQNIPAPR